MDPVGRTAAGAEREVEVEAVEAAHCNKSRTDTGMKTRVGNCFEGMVETTKNGTTAMVAAVGKILLWA